MKIIQGITFIVFGLVLIPVLIHFISQTDPQDLEVGDIYNNGLITYFLEPQDAGYIEGERNALIVHTDFIGMQEWGCRGGLVGIDPANDGTSILFGTGLQNTLNIIESHDAWDAVAGPTCHIAWEGGVAARDVYVNNYFLPSLEELQLIYDLNHIVNVPLNVYWSSSEEDAWEAYQINFSTGVTTGNFKSIENHYIPVSIANITPPTNAIISLVGIVPFIFIAVIISAIIYILKKL